MFKNKEELIKAVEELVEENTSLNIERDEDTLSKGYISPKVYNKRVEERKEAGQELINNIKTYMDKHIV